MDIFKSRNRELFGIVFVFIIMSVGFLELSLATKRSWDLFSLRLPISMGIFFFLAHLAVRLKAPNADCTLLPITFLFVGIGAITIFRLQPDISSAQVMWVAVGLASMVVTLLVLNDYSRLADYKYLFGLAGLILLLAPTLIGFEVGGAKLWLSIGGHSIQPAEFAKLFLVIFFAAYLYDKQELLKAATHKVLGVAWPETRHFGPLLAMWVISLAVLVFEKDLGSSLLFFGLFLAMIYIATGRGAYVSVGVILFLIGAIISYYLFNHVETRVDIWLHQLPADISGRFYQVAQSLFALSAGGLTGTGLGSGFLGSRIHMPAILTDFIFSAIGEELGLAGTAALLLVYLYFIFRGFYISLSLANIFGRILVAGLVFSLGFQVIVIIGGVIKAIPLTGVTLPFISYGGSSIVANFILLGIIMSISNNRRPDAQTD